MKMKRLMTMLAAMCAAVCALAAFLTAPGEVAKVADWELNKGGAYTAAKAAKFWWDYADGKPKAKMEAVRLHAAMWYELALGENAYSGNEAKIVQGRIEETKSYGGAEMQERATLAKQVNELKPIVLEVKSKTLIEFVGVPAGEFMMGTDDPKEWNWCLSIIKPHKVIITRPFWLSKFKVTKEIWNAYQKTKLTDFEKAIGGMRGPQIVSYIEAMEFCEWLTKRVRSKLPNGYIVRLPTEAEWEYALFIKDLDAGSLYRKWKANQSAICFSEKEVKQIAFDKNVDTSTLAWHDLSFAEVGRKKPNRIGLYDILGSGFEVVLDTFDDSSFTIKDVMIAWDNANQKEIIYEEREIDPLRYCRFMPRCIQRGALPWNWYIPNPYGKRGGELTEHMNTLRLCIGPDLMKEKGYKFKPPKK